MRKCSEQELIQKITDYSKEIGRIPKMREIAFNKDIPPINQFLKIFGTWNNVLKESNLEIQRIRSYSKEYLLGVLKREANKLRRTPKSEEFNNNQKLPSAQSYFKHFGSWNKALKKAGLEVNVKNNYRKKELIDMLNKRANELKRTPTSNDLGRKNNLPDRSVFENKFGSWNKALKKSGLEIHHNYKKWTKEEIIKWLRFKYKELGRTPGIRDFDKDPKAPAKNTVRKLFGNWTTALRKSKIPIKRFWSEEELIKVLQKLYIKSNKTPTKEELNQCKYCPSLTPFVKTFGSYTAACLRANLTPNDGRNNKIWRAWEKHCIEMAKVIYGHVEIKNKEVVEGIPDIYVKEAKLFIDAKTCGYRDFKEQVKKYCKKEHKLEFWCIFRGIENKSEKIKYVYAEELAKRMKKLGREELAVKCHQFSRNVFDEEQKMLNLKDKNI